MGLFLFNCEDIGKGYDWRDQLSSGFSKRYGTLGYDYGWNASYSPYDQGIIIVGKRSPSIGGKSDLWAIKTDNRGQLEWEKNFGGAENDEGYDVIATSDGGFLFVGYTWSFGSQQQVYAIKTDFYGNIIWEKNYGAAMWDVGNAVIEINDGGYLIVGYSNSPGISSGNTDFYLIKIDYKGSIIWQKAFGNLDFPNHEWAYDVIQLQDSGFLIVGGRDRYSDGAINGLVLRLDQFGNLIWEKEFIDDQQLSETFYSISVSLNGNYFICGATNSIDNPEKYQPRVIKIDGFGNVEWQRTLKSNSKDYHQFRATSNKSDEIIVVGTSLNEVADTYKSDAFLTKINSNGNIIWSYPYGSVDEDDWGWSVFETPEKNIVFVGSTRSFGASLFDIYLVGTNKDGISK